MNEKEELDRRFLNPFISCDLHFKEVEHNNKSKKHQVIAMYNQLNLKFKSVIDKCSPLLFKHRTGKVDFKYSTSNECCNISFPIIEMIPEKIIISIRPHESIKNHVSLCISRVDSGSEHLTDYFTIKHDTIEKDGFKDKCWQLKITANKNDPYLILNEYAVKRILSYIIRLHSNLNHIYQ
ncbi:hypothetical protein ABEH08_23015 [Pantoea agglomerans]|uniref:hypothetical protein n=1 Tax=Enterobacter agglomerans TaxID=549 RepID=UPI0016548355|nr:hypothetical protein [Pantoea agglomerans]